MQLELNKIKTKYQYIANNKIIISFQDYLNNLQNTMINFKAIMIFVENL